MSKLDNITREEALYDLKRMYEYFEQVNKGEISSNNVSKEGAFRRMVYNYAIKNLK